MEDKFLVLNEREEREVFKYLNIGIFMLLYSTFIWGKKWKW